MSETEPHARVDEPGGAYRPVRHDTNLEVWRFGLDLADGVYEVSALFPKDELFGLTSQVRRAAASVPPTIAEGSPKEYAQFLRYARGAPYEVETQLRIAARRGYVSDDRVRPILDPSASISRMPNRLMRALG